MTIFDSSLVGIVLPLMIEDSQIQFSSLQWFVSIYLIFFASFLLPAGLAGDKYGRKKTLLTGLAVFSLSAMMCSVLSNITTLVIARAFQGVGAAFMLAPALSIIGHSFRDPEQTPRVWAIWGSIMGLTMVCAPLLSGLASAQLGWRSAFAVMGISGLLLLTQVVAHIRESRDPNAKPFDWPNAVTFCFVMMVWTSILILGPDFGWSSQPILQGYLLGIVVTVLYLYLETNSRTPMLDLSLFRSLKFNGAVIAMLIYAATAQVMLTFLPLYLQKLHNIDPLWLGVAMLPFSVAMFVFPHLARFLSKHLSSVQTLSIGLLVIAAGNFGLSLAAEYRDELIFFVMMLILGAGGGFINGETQKAILGAMPKDKAGMASGISTTARFSGVLIGFVILSVVFAVTLKRSLQEQLCTGQGSPCEQATLLLPEVVAGNFDKLTTLSPELQTTAMQSFGTGFSWLFALAGTMALLTAIFVFRAMRD